MEEYSSSNQRIAKNTLYLYFRMLITLVVSLYTSRVVLNALGAEDYGIYSVVGGVVIVLGFLNNAMAGATQRFLNYAMGKNDSKSLNYVFSTSLVIHIIVAIIILSLAETIGLWFLNNKMNISIDRMNAANWVYQFSVLAFVASILGVPYNASIVAHERMSFFAYMGIIEVFLKLFVALAILYSPFDRLILYSFLMLLISILTPIIYGIYCKRYFEECYFKRESVEKTLLKKMLSFASWTIFGNLGYILHTQGIAVVINMFFCSIVNAAQGISNQVNTVVKSFVTNFLMALNPQIVKSYAANDLPVVYNLITRGCRISFCMILFLVLPLILETPIILQIWLKNVPEYTVIFVRLVLFITLCDSYSNVLATTKGATGDIKIYQITLTTIGFFHVPIAWVFFALGFQPYYAMYVYVVIIIVLQIVRIWFTCRAVGYSILNFYKNVVGRCFLITLASSIFPIFLHRIVGGTVGGAISVTSLSIISVGLCTLYIGLDKRERAKILSVAKRKILLILNK